MLKLNDERIHQIVMCYVGAKCTFLYGEHSNGKLFAGLLIANHGYVCKECGDRNLESCTPVNPKLIDAIRDGRTLGNVLARVQKAFGHKTNAQLANELGISKRQVSKRRKRGEL